MAQRELIVGIIGGTIATVLGGIVLYYVLPQQNTRAPSSSTPAKTAPSFAGKIPTHVKATLPSGGSVIGQFRTYESMKIEGAQIVTSEATSALACKKDCDGVDECVAFHFSKTTPGWSVWRYTCVLFSNVSAVRRTPPGEIKGEPFYMAGLRLN